jgi:isopentenyldiphosphate isomerase
MKREKIVIVDENDNIICSKYRDEVDYYCDIRRSAGIWVTNNANQVLIAQRSYKKKIDPGKWGPAVQGSIGVDETYDSNAYKEIEEELGVKCAKLIKFKKQFVSYPMKYFSQWYLYSTDLNDYQFKFPKDEVENIKWVNKNELLSDIENNPDKYVPCMIDIFKFLI